MPDLTVTWKGAVPFEAAYGQSAVKGDGVVFDARALAGGFDVRPANDGSMESALKDAVPYIADDEGDYSWVDEFEDALVQAEVIKPKAVRKK
jgi:hypothetical protein